jgi:hypothetical protein
MPFIIEDVKDETEITDSASEIIDSRETYNKANLFSDIQFSLTSDTITNSVSEIFEIPDPIVKMISTNTNTYGEILVNFELSDPSNRVDNLVIMCDYLGIKAPIGAFAKLEPGDLYTFTDNKTHKYPGKRTYSVIVITKSGDIFDSVSNTIVYNKGSNIPEKLLINPVNKNPSENFGIRNDIQTEGKGKLVEPTSAAAINISPIPSVFTIG